MIRAYRPAYAATMPQKINVKLPTGKSVLRSVRWHNFLPDWLESADAPALTPYVAINNNPYIITTHNGEITGLITLSAYLKTYGVNLYSCSGGKNSSEWWKYIQ